MKIKSPTLARVQQKLGRHIQEWRKVNGLTAEDLASRAGITRSTLHAIESGAGSVKSENLFSVLEVLGIADALVDAADPINTEIGRARADRITVQRVRKATPRW
ncbi:helix-turn-helix domain-containing protein [Ruania rhizosphaerae]|uniref:helix-turn-helix domain-containing protein n=1 Tax=Ruania rhizosphaerae TaxID=1840413 RepID=UPI00135B23C8|nr:helix-turn-helix transcriptional regulator [Ruania rhizosphaerae]